MGSSFRCLSHLRCCSGMPGGSILPRAQGRRAEGVGSGGRAGVVYRRCPRLPVWVGCAGRSRRPRANTGEVSRGSRESRLCVCLYLLSLLVGADDPGLTSGTIFLALLAAALPRLVAQSLLGHGVYEPNDDAEPGEDIDYTEELAY